MLKPLHNLVLAQREPTETKMGLIALPDDRIEQSLWVRVLAVGPGLILKNGERQRMPVKVGGRYLLRQWSGVRLEPEKNFMSPVLVPVDFLEAEDE